MEGLLCKKKKKNQSETNRRGDITTSIKFRLTEVRRVVRDDNVESVHVRAVHVVPELQTGLRVV